MILEMPRVTNEQMLDEVVQRLTGEKEKILAPGKQKLSYMLQVIIEPVTDQLIDFCRESPAFLAAVYNAKGTLDGCLRECIAQCKHDPSDDAVYSCTARYYLPGCAIKHTRKLVTEPEKEKSPALVSWMDLL